METATPTMTEQEAIREASQLLMLRSEAKDLALQIASKENALRTFCEENDFTGQLGKALVYTKTFETKPALLSVTGEKVSKDAIQQLAKGLSTKYVTRSLNMDLIVKNWSTDEKRLSKLKEQGLTLGDTEKSVKHYFKHV